MYLLALAQGVFNAVAPELLVVVDEGERQVDVQGVGPVGGRRPLPGLKGDHQIHPGGRPLDLELVDEILAEDLTQQLLELVVDPQRAVGSTWGGKSMAVTRREAGGDVWSREELVPEAL